MIIDPVTITMGRHEFERLIAAAEYHAKDVRKRATMKDRDGKPTRLAADRLRYADSLEETASECLARIRQYDHHTSTSNRTK